MHIQNSKITVVGNGTFIRAERGLTVVMENVEVSGGNNGATARFADAGEHTIRLNCTVSNSSCVTVTSGSNLEFSNFKVTGHGNGRFLLLESFSALTLQYVEVSGFNYAGDYRASGAVLASNDGGNKIDILNCDFHNNTINGGFGGAIYLVSSIDLRDNNNTLNISGSTISNNKAHSFGGALYTQATVYITSSVLNNNDGGFGGGGGIYLYSGYYSGGSTLYMASSVLENNAVGRWGGGIFLDTSSTAYITSSVFKLNTALLTYGGAIFVNEGSTTTISTSQFIMNRAPIGGALRFNSPTVTYISSCNFTSNTATNGGGGGIAQWGGGTTSILRGSMFTGNTGSPGTDISCVSSGTITIFPSGQVPTGDIYHDGSCTINNE